MNNMDRVFTPKTGSFGYRSPGKFHPDLTGVGVLAKLLWQGRADHEVRAGLESIISKELNYQARDFSFYGWYYDTQACFQAQGAAWNWWNSRFQTQLTSHQSADGSWPANPNAKQQAEFQCNPGGDALCIVPP